MQIQLKICIRFFHIKKVNSMKLFTFKNDAKLRKVKIE